MELGLWLLTDSCTCDFLNKHYAKQPCLKYLWLLLPFSVMQLDTIICPLSMITTICNNILLLQYVSILNENELITFDVFDSPRSLQLRYFSPVGFCHDMIHVTTLIYICYTFPILFTTCAEWLLKLLNVHWYGSSENYLGYRRPLLLCLSRKGIQSLQGGEQTLLAPQSLWQRPRSLSESCLIPGADLIWGNRGEQEWQGTEGKSQMQALNSRALCISSQKARQ